MISVRTILALLLAMVLAAACATGPSQQIEPGERPAIDTVEAGLWMQMDKFEKTIRTSGKVVEDAELNAYVRNIVCRLAADYCKDIRIYIVQTPGFNASMAPNGSMLIWTGMLLRAENEAQLAYVLGHELAHYLNRHSVQRWHDIRNKTDALAFFQIATAMAGVVIPGASLAGTMATIATLGSIAAFSQEQEKDADEIGFEMVRAAGYRVDEPAKIWSALIEEKEASEKPKSNIFFATHPPSKERESTLIELAENTGKDEKNGIIGQERFVTVTAPYRARWLRDEIRQRDYGALGVVFTKLIEANVNPGELYYYQGELHRLRRSDEEDDKKKAIDAYTKALETGAAPPETYRALGIVYWADNRLGEAKSAFENYLELQPDAEDRLIVEDYLKQIQRSQG